MIYEENRGPSTENCVGPAVLSFQIEDWSFRTTL